MSDKNKTQTIKITTKKQVNNDKWKKDKKALEDKVLNLEKQIHELKNDNKSAVDSFLDKAQSFQGKAKQKIEEFKEEHKVKLEEKIELIKKYAPEKIIKELVEPLLNLELAVRVGKQQNSKDVQNYVIGFEMLLKQIDSILESHDIFKITPKIGDVFNPESMDAISTIDNKEQIDKVIEVKKYGFKLHDRIIKPATVVIGK